MLASLISQIGYQYLFYIGLAAIPLIIICHYLGIWLTPLLNKLSAKTRLSWLRWQKRGQFAHYTKETLDRYSFQELYDVVKASLAVDDFRTAEHILVHLFAHPDANQRPDLYHLLGSIYYRYGNLNKAKLVCQQGVRTNPQFYDTYQLLGQILDDSQDYGTALNIARKAIQADPSRYEAYLLSATIHQKQRRRKEALVFLDQGLAQQPKSLPLLKAKLDVLLKEAQMKTALELAESILAIHPKEKTTLKISRYLRKKLGAR